MESAATELDVYEQFYTADDALALVALWWPFYSEFFPPKKPICDVGLVWTMGDINRIHWY